MPLPGVGRAHKPCAAALFCKHSEHRRCKMCDFDQKYEFINSLGPHRFSGAGFCVLRLAYV